MSEQGTLYFFTGLAGAGKTTIGGLFYQRLKIWKPDAVLLDGDKQRYVAGQAAAIEAGSLTQDDDRIYSTEARKAGARGTAIYCQSLINNGKDVVLCSISMYSEIRSWYRENIENYREIYIRVGWETLRQRNQKGLYSPGRKNVVGVDLPWDEPETPDIVIWNDGHETPDEIVNQLESLFLMPKEFTVKKEEKSA